MPNAIDNSNLKNYRSSERDGFVPSVAYEYDQEAAEIDVTDNSTFPSGKALKKVKIQVFDKFSGEVRGYILPTEGSDSGHDGETTIDVSDLNRSKPLDIKATVIVDDDKLIADGIAKDIGTAGELGEWDIQKNA